MYRVFILLALNDQFAANVVVQIIFKYQTQKLCVRLQYYNNTYTKIIYFQKAFSTMIKCRLYTKFTGRCKPARPLLPFALAFYIGHCFTPVIILFLSSKLKTSVALIASLKLYFTVKKTNNICNDVQTVQERKNLSIQLHSKLVKLFLFNKRSPSVDLLLLNIQFLSCRCFPF